MKKTIQISGANGGGQILRSALSLALVTGNPFRLSEIRGQRPKPGLMRQHLTCVKAAAEISQGSVDGAAIGSQEIIFQPGEVQAGAYQFAIGTAGSTTLLAQTLLPALMGAKGESELTLEGGTHNPLAPPMDFVQRVYLPMLERMRVSIEGRLERHGFAPAGGGKICLRLPGGQKPIPLELVERGKELSKRVHCVSSRVPESVPRKETGRLCRKLNWPDDCVEIADIDDSDGPGNVLSAEMQFENVTERVSSTGAHGKPSTKVADETARMMRDYLGTGAVVGRRLADQLLLPMALAGSGSFLTMKPSNHVLTSIEVIERFLPVQITTEELGGGLWKIAVGS